MAARPTMNERHMKWFTGEKPPCNNGVHRDSLGRIVYEGDVLTGGYEVVEVMGRRIEFFDENDDACSVLAYTLTIDLRMSPSRTNYERYFADLGTLEEVRGAFYGDRQDSDLCKLRRLREECPFAAIAGRCGDWPRWLDERAAL